MSRTSYSVTCNLISSCVRQWAGKDQPKCWQKIDVCHQAKIFLHRPNPKLTRFALGLRRVIRRVRRHDLNKHLVTMHVHNDPLCPACGEDEEILLHFLGKCCATMVTCYHIMRAYTLQLKQLCKVAVSNLLQFAKV